MRETAPSRVPTIGLSPNILVLFRELNDLKRVYSAGRSGSIATRLFLYAWSALIRDCSTAQVALRTTRKALAAARLGDLDRLALTGAGIPAERAAQIENDAILAVTGSLGSLTDILATGDLEERDCTDHLPPFVGALAQQPRAGITCPGKPRILLEPPENHAEHCLMVAVYGVLLAPVYQADPGTVFLASLAHHLHNAGMPDAGFTGEMLLGPDLQAVVRHHTEAALRQLAPTIRTRIEDARIVLADAATPEGRAFHAADVLDRVLQLNQYTRAGALTPTQMLDEMKLVHEGPVKGFHDDVLRQVELL